MTQNRDIQLHPTGDGTAQDIPTRLTGSLILTPSDPGLVSTTIANVINYPEQNDKLPVGGVWAVKSTADVPAAATLDELYFEYSTDYAGDEGAATWTAIASLTGGTITDNGDGTYQHVGDDVAVPSGLTAIRARSVGADADEQTFVMAVSSATPNRVAHESFASPDGTVLDTSYVLDSGQNISGYNRGAQTLGGEMAGRTGVDTTWGQSWWVGVGSQNQLVRGLYSFNGTSGSGDEDGGNSILLRTPNYYNHVRARMAGGGGIALNEQGAPPCPLCIASTRASPTSWRRRRPERLQLCLFTIPAAQHS